ncbi:sensor histidine kinase [Halobaculum marinum]|uniref:histidine kinase n=1 Tax=Halobaculum marinum TaxID=3031996 RepID=A0ABD5X1A0_9EURY|nr:HAMP domain-containing sensor histidine kinase [Halobaculum sp. DT55]
MSAEPPRATIQLLVAERGNRRALASILGSYYDVTDETDIAQADPDLILVDDSSFPANRVAIAAHKRATAPVLCPVLLVRRELSSVSVTLPDPVTAEPPMLVNEVTAAPVDRQSLLHTVANLLTQRRQTISLREQAMRMERFSRTLRHELRNPLNILTGYLRRARETGEVEAFDKCTDALDRMNRMIDEALLLIETDRDRIDTTRLSLAAQAEESWGAVSDRGATLRTPADVTVVADEFRLKQLLENLFRNAVEHGAGDATVTVGPLADGFHVSDDGSGIPVDRREVVLEEGYTTARSSSGLGLAVVSAVAAAHDWDLTVTESADGGARFEFRGVDTE